MMQGADEDTFSVHDLAQFGLSKTTAVVAAPHLAALSFGAPVSVYSVAEVSGWMGWDGMRRDGMGWDGMGRS